MTARRARIFSSLVAVSLTAACTSYYEIPIETPIRPKLDVSAFQRVLVAGFLSGGTDDVDANLETTRLLRSQLRTKSDLRVIDTDVLPLMDVATESRGTNDAESAVTTNGSGEPPPIKEEKDLEPYEHIFADVEYLEAHRRGVSEPADRDRHGDVHAALALRHRSARAGGVRLVRPAARGARTNLHGA